MKVKIKKTEVLRNYKNVICVPYCALQRTLKAFDPIAYVAGNDGWHADVYDFGCTAIVTGYQAFGSIKPDYRIYTQYEERAQKLFDAYVMDYKTWAAKSKELIQEFLDDVTGKEQKMKFDVALLERPHDEGFTREEIDELLELLPSNAELVPISVEGINSAALGFVTQEIAETDCRLEDFVKEILNDMELESENGCYDIPYSGRNIRMLLTRNLETTVVFSVRGGFSCWVPTTNEDTAKKIAQIVCNEADFGALEQVEAQIVRMEPTPFSDDPSVTEEIVFGTMVWMSVTGYFSCRIPDPDIKQAKLTACQICSEADFGKLEDAEYEIVHVETE